MFASRSFVMSVMANRCTFLPSSSSSLLIFSANVFESCPSLRPTMTPNVLASAALYTARVALRLSFWANSDISRTSPKYGSST